MNKLLRKPWVVASLVLGMAALWWVQMRSIMLPGSEAAAAPTPVAVVETASVEQSASDSTVTEPLSISLAAKPTRVRWDSAPLRDPFAPLAPALPVVAPAPVEQAPVEPVVVVTQDAIPALEAVLHTPSAHIAVIDGRIVRVGDKVSGRAVLKIDAASVALGASPNAQAPLVLKLPTR